MSNMAYIEKLRDLADKGLLRSNLKHQDISSQNLIGSVNTQKRISQ